MFKQNWFVLFLVECGASLANGVFDCVALC